MSHEFKAILQENRGGGTIGLVRPWVRLYEDDGLNEKEFKAFRVSFVEVPFWDIFIKHTSGTSRWVQYSK